MRRKTQKLLQGGLPAKIKIPRPALPPSLPYPFSPSFVDKTTHTYRHPYPFFDYLTLHSLLLCLTCPHATSAFCWCNDVTPLPNYLTIPSFLLSLASLHKALSFCCCNQLTPLNRSKAITAPPLHHYSHFTSSPSIQCDRILSFRNGNLANGHLAATKAGPTEATQKSPYEAQSHKAWSLNHWHNCK